MTSAVVKREAASEMPVSGINKGVPWSESEHRAFLKGLAHLGKGNWRGISLLFVKTRSPTQVASHAQKYFLRLNGCTKRRSRFTTMEQSQPAAQLAMEQATRHASAATTPTSSGSSAAGLKASPTMAAPQVTPAQQPHKQQQQQQQQQPPAAFMYPPVMFAMPSPGGGSPTYMPVFFSPHFPPAATPPAAKCGESVDIVGAARLALGPTVVVCRPEARRRSEGAPEPTHLSATVTPLASCHSLHASATSAFQPVVAATATAT